MSDVDRRIRAHRSSLRRNAIARWAGFQPIKNASPDSIPNRDGTVPVPRIAVATDEQVARFSIREEKRKLLSSPSHRGLRIALERKIGATLDFSDLPPNQQALMAGRPVARLVTLGGAGREPQGFATGFLVHPCLLITNHHVFRTSDEANGVGAQFLYERVHDGVRSGLIFPLEPSRFFVCDETLDYAIVSVAPRSTSGALLSQFNFLPLIAAKGKILKGDPVNIIQHPDGRPKQYATVNNRLIDLRDDGFLLYETDTLEGSSGAPVYNRHWEVIGLHHSGVPLIENGYMVLVDDRRVPVDADVADAEVVWIANEGIRVSALVASLARQSLAKAEQRSLLAELIEKTVDPVTWVESVSPQMGPVAVLNSESMPKGADMGSTVMHMTGPVTVYVQCRAAEAESKAAPETFASPIPTGVGAGDGAMASFRERALRFDEDYPGRNRFGYQADFLSDWTVPAPEIAEDFLERLAPVNEGNQAWVVPYYHYSLVMSATRRLLIWAACNVDYSQRARKYTKSRKEYGGENWRLDPRVAMRNPSLQLEDAHFYAPAKKIDRGHIVRREDVAWGTSAREAEYGNSDSYHWTNCTPQHETFNQATQEGVWGQFEEHIQRQVKALEGRMTVFAGPVLRDSDPQHGYDEEHLIQVPMAFWKVVLCTAEENGARRRYSYGFMFDQTESVERLGYERMDMTDYDVYQLAIPDITKETGVVFDESVYAADVAKGATRHESIRAIRVKRIRKLDDVILQ